MKKFRTAIRFNELTEAEKTESMTHSMKRGNALA